MFREGRWWLEDLASQNGTLLNGARINVTTALKTGDAIALGTVLVGFAEVGESSGRVKLQPQGVPVAGRRMTGEVLMQGMPARRPASTEKFEEVATASGEGGPTVDFAEIDSELTSPSGINVKAELEHGRAAEPTNPVGIDLNAAVAKAKGGPSDATNTDLPVIDDDGPPTNPPGSIEQNTHVGPAPERKDAPEKGPVLVPRPSISSRPGTRPPRPATQPPRASVPPPAASLPPRATPDQLTRADAPLVPRPSAPRPQELERASGLVSEPVLVPRPTSLKQAEISTGPRTGGASEEIKSQETQLKPSPLEDVLTVAKAPLVPEPTPMPGAPKFEETKIHSVGPPANAPSKPNISATKPVVSTVPAPPTVESAAEKARRRREAEKSVWLAMQYKWTELPRRTQLGLMVGLGVLVLGGGVGGVLASRAPSRPDRGPEVRSLSFADDPVPQSYGMGFEVDFEHPTEKTFSFQLETPGEAAIVVHLRGQGIGAQEIGVTVNGNEVGFVPEDYGIATRELEVLIPPKPLLRGNENVLSFENRKSADGKETWRISDIKLELLALPPDAKENELLDEANKLAKQATDQLGAKEVPTQNMYKAWVLYRKAWILLLGIPEGKRPGIFQDSRVRHAELGKELDQRCGGYLLEAKKQMELKNPDRAKEILDEIPLHFPGKEHRCQNLAKQKAEEYDL